MNGKRGKLIFVLFTMLGLSAWFEFAFAVDSTAPMFTSGTGTTPTVSTPATVANQAFVAETGYANPGTTAAYNSDPHKAGFGAMFYDSTKCHDVTLTANGQTIAYCMVYASTALKYSTTHPLCPLNFTAHYTVAMDRAYGDTGATHVVCPLATIDATNSENYTFPVVTPTAGTGAAAGYYNLFAAVSATPGVNGTLIPNAGFRWTITCDPNTNPPGPQNDPGCLTSPNLQHQPILWDSGSLQTNTAAGAYSQFSTNSICPGGYFPYVILTAQNDDDPNTAPTAASGVRLSVASKVCVHKIQLAAPNSYQVLYKAEKIMVPIAYTSTSFTIGDPVTSESRPAAATQINNVDWHLYCYPPTVATPTPNPNC